MGCHTWAYEQIDLDSLSLTAIKAELKERYTKEIKCTRDAMLDEEYKSELPLMKENIKQVEVLLKNLKYINKKRKGLKLYCEWSLDGIYTYHKGKLYKALDGDIDIFHDMFRISDYDQKPLTSKEETIIFITNENNECYGIDLDRVHEYWNKYTDGLLTFG